MTARASDGFSPDVTDDLAQQAANILRDARRELGHDLCGFGVVDLFCDNLPVSTDLAQQLAFALDEA